MEIIYIVSVFIVIISCVVRQDRGKSRWKHVLPIKTVVHKQTISLILSNRIENGKKYRFLFAATIYIILAFCVGCLVVPGCLRSFYFVVLPVISTFRFCFYCSNANNTHVWDFHSDTTIINILPDVSHFHNCNLFFHFVKEISIFQFFVLL